VTFLGNSVSIDPSAALIAGVDYYVTVGAGARRPAGNAFAGLSNTTVWTSRIADDYPFHRHAGRHRGRRPCAHG
jgi:hypothetical protein